VPRRAPAHRRSYREQRELDGLPAQIQSIEETIRSLEARIHGPEFYREPPSVISGTLSDLDARQADLQQAYARWDELENKG
jgi:ATP-binding cassette subfamily F protein uup